MGRSFVGYSGAYTRDDYNRIFGKEEELTPEEKARRYNEEVGAEKMREEWTLQQGLGRAAGLAEEMTPEEKARQYNEAVGEDKMRDEWFKSQNEYVHAQAEKTREYAEQTRAQAEEIRRKNAERSAAAAAPEVEAGAEPKSEPEVSEPEVVEGAEGATEVAEKPEISTEDVSTEQEWEPIVPYNLQAAASHDVDAETQQNVAEMLNVTTEELESMSKEDIVEILNDMEAADDEDAVAVEELVAEGENSEEAQAKVKERKGFFRRIGEKLKGRIKYVVAIVGLAAALLVSSKLGNELMQQRAAIEATQENAGNETGDEAAGVAANEGLISDEVEATAEKTGASAHFTVEGNEYDFTNTLHEGGYNIYADTYFDDGKDGEHSMSAHAYEGSWKGAESAAEAIENNIDNLKKSAGIMAQIGMVTGTIEANSLRELNNTATNLKNGDTDAYDAVANEVSDYVTNFMDGGKVVIHDINGEYASTYSMQTNRAGGSVNTFVDLSVKHDYTVHAMDIVKDGESLFNSDDAKEKIRDLFGLSDDVEFTAGWSAECGQIVIQIENEDVPDDEPTPTPTPEPTPEPTDGDEPSSETDDDGDEDDGGGDEDDGGGDEDDGGGDEDDGGDEGEEENEEEEEETEEETEDEGLAPKTENTHAGDDVHPMGDTDPNAATGELVYGNEGVSDETERNPGEQVNDADADTFNEVNEEKIAQDQANSTSEETQTQYSEDTSGWQEGSTNAVTGETEAPTSNEEENLANPGSMNNGEETNYSEEELGDIYQNMLNNSQNGNE